MFNDVLKNYKEGKDLFEYKTEKLKALRSKRAKIVKEIEEKTADLKKQLHILDLEIKILE